MKRTKFLLSFSGALFVAACLYCPVFHAMPKFMERYDAAMPRARELMMANKND